MRINALLLGFGEVRIVKNRNEIKRNKMTQGNQRKQPSDQVFARLDVS